ncbi:MAG TPA: hypothetical protein VHO69_12745 [Phototrophicaceae bacterium]|nr:hypothetical protein [Phototrophicaceae bacterium]
MKYLMVLFSFVLVLTACAPSATPSSTAVPTTGATAFVQPTPTQETLGQPVAQSGPDAGGVVRPAWQTLPLVNARTGETFTFADLAGKVIFVEPMATWCTTTVVSSWGMSR